MAKQTVITMPGDGIGNQVLPEALRVLKVVGFNAEYIHADIGWECWRNEGNALPDRTIDLLAKHKLGLFGAITSKPNREAQAELGFGYLRQGRINEARDHLETGVALLKQSKKGVGFTVRAMQKLALYYLRTWQLRRGVLQFDEAYELALTNGIHGQITKPMLFSHWIRQILFR